MIGKETREVTADMNVQKTRVTQANTVPLSPVRGPNPSSMSGVGQELRGLASVLGGISDTMAQYKKRADDESFIDGQLARAQGKSLQEAEEMGNRAGPGWIAADMKDSAERFYMEQSQLIQKQHYNMTTDDYRTYLNGSFKEMYQDVPNDPSLKEAALSLSSDVFSRLARDQVAAHQTFNYEQTRVSGANMLNSTLDARPGDEGTAQINELLDPKTLGLKPEDHASMLVDVATYRVEAHSDRRLMDALRTQMRTGAPEALRAITPTLSRTEDAIISVESAGRTFAADGSILQGPQIVEPDGSIRKGPSGAPDRARGKYQVMESTFHDAYTRKRLGLPAEGNFNDAEQVNDFGQRYLQESSAIMGGDPKLIALAHVSGWNIVDNGVLRGIPDPRTGAISVEDFIVRHATATIRDPKYRDRTIADRLDYVAKVDREYSKTADVQMIAPTQIASASGTYPLNYAALERLQDTYVKVAKKEQELATVSAAVANRTLGILPQKDQVIGLNAMRQASVVEAQEASPRRPDEDQLTYQNRVMDDAQKLYFTKLHQQPDVIDEQLKGSIAASLSSGNLFDASETSGVSQSAMDMLGTLLALEGNTSPQYVEKYLPENDVLIRTALSLVADGGMEYAEALKAADVAQKRADGGIKFTPVNADVVDKAVTKVMNKYASGWWDRIVPNWVPQSEYKPEAKFSPWHNLGMTKSVIEAGMKTADGVLYRNKVEVLANTLARTQGLPPEAAVRKALGQVQSRTINIAGRPFAAPATTNISSLYGVPDDYFTKYPGAMTLAVGQYLRAVGDYGALQDGKLAIVHSALKMSEVMDAVVSMANNDGSMDVAQSDATRTLETWTQEQKNEMGAFGPKFKSTQSQTGTFVPFRNAALRVPNYENQMVSVDWDSGNVSVNLVDKNGQPVLNTSIVIPRDVLSVALQAIPQGSSNEELRELFKQTD